ncbi:MAG: aminotransferase class IV [Oscillospiraceae bacterium]|nr:aminotransferase class IV [Oscillospiraceae bacterium]
MKKVGYFNGEIGPLEEMKIPMTARSVYFGDGVYDAAMIANGVVFDLEDHLDRFYNSLRLLDIRNFAFDREQLKKELLRTAAEAEGDVLLLYWQADRGSWPRQHRYPPEDVKANLLITVTPKKLADIRLPVKLITAEDTRYLHCNVKTLNLIPNVMANQKAAEAGCDEAVFHRGSIVTEGSYSNVSILSAGRLITHPADELILPGISRKHLLGLAGKLGVECVEREFTLDEMFGADEVFITGSTTLVRRADSIDGKSVGGRAGELFLTLQGAYMDRVREITGLDIPYR